MPKQHNVQVRADGSIVEFKRRKLKKNPPPLSREDQEANRAKKVAARALRKAGKHIKLIVKVKNEAKKTGNGNQKSK